MSRSASLISLAAALVVVSVASASCSSGQPSASVAVPTPSSDAITSACNAMHVDLPSAVDGSQRRDASPASLLTAAWGDPAITWRCGVGVPAGFNAQSQVLTINGVGWFGASGTDGSTTFTTVGRVARVEVYVPSTVQPASDALLDLSEPILNHDPATGS